MATSSRGFLVTTEAGEDLPCAAVVAATGSFENPHRQVLPGQKTFTGDLLHVAGYRNRAPYTGRRVVVVGAGDSAVPVASDLLDDANVTLARRHPVTFFPQQLDGRDLHYWLDRSGFDDLPPGWLVCVFSNTLVTDTGGYRHALDTGKLDHRPLSNAFEGDRLVWSDGTREVVMRWSSPRVTDPRSTSCARSGPSATGCRSTSGVISTTHPGLVYVGLEFQASYASNTLRGVSRDAASLAAVLAAHVNDAAALIRV